MRVFALLAVLSCAAGPSIWSGCSDPHAIALDLEGYVLSMASTTDGSRLLVSYSSRYVFDHGFAHDSWAVFDTATWMLLADHRLDDRRLGGFTACSGRDRAVTFESSPAGASPVLGFRHIPTGSLVAEVPRDERVEISLPVCAPSRNTIYISIRPSVVSEIDLEDGAVVREYDIGGEEMFVPFWVQDARDRLVVRNYSTGELTTFRLSTGERLGSVCAVCGFEREEISGLAMLDDEYAMAMVVTGEGSGMRMHLVLIDLEALQVVRTFDIGTFRGYDGFWPMDPGLASIALFLSSPVDRLCTLISRLDGVTGEVTPVYDGCAPGVELARVLDDLDQFWMMDRTRAEGWRYKVYRFPSGALLGEAPVPRVFWDQGLYAPGSRRALQASGSDGDFAVYDAERIALLDHFKLCGKGVSSMILDPTERWLAARCADRKCDTLKDPMECSGKGIMIVDLARYR
jgi:hypothetical protein